MFQSSLEIGTLIFTFAFIARWVNEMKNEGNYITTSNKQNTLFSLRLFKNRTNIVDRSAFHWDRRDMNKFTLSNVFVCTFALSFQFCYL